MLSGLPIRCGKIPTKADSANAAIRLAHSFASAEDGLSVSQSARNLINANLAEDISYCARESILPVVPRLVGAVGTGVEVALK